MLEDLLRQNKCFKLVCGAGNEDVQEVERLVYLYSKAGCRFFDLSANIDVIKSAKRGIHLAEMSENCYLCVSIGIAGDPHTSKAQIDTKLCSKCKTCINICPQYAIAENNEFCQVKKEACIGCTKCIKICPNNAISMYTRPFDIDEFIPEILNEVIDCIEFHANIENETQVMEKWKTLNNIYDGILSICIDRSNLGNKRYISRIKNMIKNRAAYTTIIQADGIPISGGNNDYKSTLQAVAAAEIVQNENLPVYILLSGGTNSKTKALANMCGIFPNGIAIGSYARKIVKEYIIRDDFYSNQEIQNKALEIAKNLVESCVE